MANAVAKTADKVPVPRVITPDMFYSAHMPRLDESVVIETAKQYGIEPEVLMAFSQVESPKGPYMPDGRPYILFEAHVFSRNCKPQGKYDDDHPTLSTPRWNSKLYGAGGDWQYQRLQTAMLLDQSAALCACSWGSYQILGENWKMLGFQSVEEMVLYMVQSEANQFDCFIRFINRRGIIAALRAKDWQTAAYKYNGSGYATHNYDGRMAQAYRDLTSHTLRRGAQGPKVVRLQKLLNKFDFALKVDGIFGPSTENAVKDMQKRWGIVVDGIVGPQTYERFAAERVESTSVLASKRNIGAGGAAVAGGAAIKEGAEALSDSTELVKQKTVLEQLKDVQAIGETTKTVVVSAKDATEKVVQIQKQSAEALIILGMIIIGIAGYVVWTKIYDHKKAQGVS
jgi:hypothetical protein